jgi:hypothetical protein
MAMSPPDRIEAARSKNVWGLLYFQQLMWPADGKMHKFILLNDQKDMQRQEA